MLYFDNHNLKDAHVIIYQNSLIILFIFQQLQSQISQIDINMINGDNAFCNESLQLTPLKKH